MTTSTAGQSAPFLPPIGDTLGSGSRFYSRPEWRRLRVAVLDRDGRRCMIGGPGCTKVGTEVDHIVPLVDGGAPLDPANCRAACRHCNAARGNRMLRERFEWAQRHMAGDGVSDAGPSREWF